jgi:peptidoglycan/xylan/chitin deacetylase (PgdA/CDA1 family)
MEAVGLAAPRPMMSAADIEAASAAGHEIGAHSYSHESMEFLDDRAFVADLERCRAVLGAAGRECDVYAFPNGSCRPSQLELLPRHGIRHALLVGERPSTRGATVHTRITVRGDSTAEARARAAGLVP